MRWVWIDRILELTIDTGTAAAAGEADPVIAGRCVAIKNLTAGEDVLHDHFPARRDADGRVLAPATPCLPHSLVIEGMAQTAGILTGKAGRFREKVILAKIARAAFHAIAGPGSTLRYEANLERFDTNGSATRGVVTLLDPAAQQPPRTFAEIDLMFSHVDRNLAGRVFPEHNFVFDGQLLELLKAQGTDLTVQQGA